MAAERHLVLAADLIEDQHVGTLAERVGLDPYATVGRLYHLWSWMKRQAPQGRGIRVSEAWIDRFLCAPGFASGMLAEGFLAPSRNGAGKLPESSRKAPGTAPESSAERSRNGAGTEFLARAFVCFLSSSRTPDKKHRGSKRKNSEKTTQIAFSEFWERYPRKEGKGAAEKSWNALGKASGKLGASAELAAEIFRKIDIAKKSEQWNRDGGKFIPHPSTWLNQRRWEDEPGKLGPNGMEPGLHLPWYCDDCATDHPFQTTCPHERRAHA